MTTAPKLTLNDPKLMYVIAHPLRMHIVGSLRINGPATSAILARRLKTDSGQTSHHLRYLAKHGFVEEAPELGKGVRGRERWWRAVHKSTEFSDPQEADQHPGRREAMLAVEHAARTVWDQAIDAFHAEVAQQKWSTEWQRIAASSDYVVRMTPSRLEWFCAEVNKLMKQCAATDERDAENVLVIMHTYPMQAER